MKECPSEKLLLKLAENELDASRASLLIEHANTCERCRNLLEQYKRTLLMLASEKIEVPGTADWERVMANVRRRTERTNQGWPLWLRGLVGAAAAACLLLILWRAGIDVGRRTGGVGELAERTETPVPYGGHDSLAPDGGTFDDATTAVDEALTAADVTSLGPAGMNYEELSELDELVVGAEALQSSDLLVFDLTEEEEARLVKELENCSSI